MTQPSTAVFPEPSTPSLGRRKRGESTVEWLRHSTRESSVASRRLLNSWLTPYLDDAEFIGKITGKEEHFRGAFLELYLDACFRQCDWNFRRPKLISTAGADENPDFVIEDSTARCYIEATTTNPNSPSEQRKLRLLNSLEPHLSGNFSLMVTVQEVGPTDLAAKPLRKQLADWLAGLDPDQVIADFNGLDLPSIPYDTEGWSFEFQATPKDPEHRGTSNRSIGGEMPAQMDSVNDDDQLFAALRKKVSKYRTLDGAYVIAVDENSWEMAGLGGDDDEHPMTDHRLDALFGKSRLAFDGQTARTVRQTNKAFWIHNQDWINTRVSAVLLTDHLAPHNALSAVPELWLHPAAARPEVPMLPIWRGMQYAGPDTNGQERVRLVLPAQSPREFWLGNPARVASPRLTRGHGRPKPSD